MFNTLYIETKQMLKISLGQNKRYEKCTLFSFDIFFFDFFLFSFTFDLKLLYKLKHKVRLSKSIWGIFHFQFRFVFVKVNVFVHQKSWTLWLWKVIIRFKIKITEKRNMLLLPHLWILSCNKKFYNSMISDWLGDKFFKLRNFLKLLLRQLQ